MTWIDTHTHLHEPDFDSDRSEVLQRAQARDVIQLIDPGEDLAGSQRSAALASQWPGYFAACGIHPHESGALQEGWIDALNRLLDRPKVVAIGEIGLDLHYAFSPLSAQQPAFEAQLVLARQRKLPVIVHTREAEEETLAFLRQAQDGSLTGVIHSFAGSASFAKACLDLGFFLSFSGIVTFKTADALREVATWVPADRILVETDAPYLAPVPHRGKRNEPAFCVDTGQVLAHLHQVPVEVLAQQTTENARKLFRLPQQEVGFGEGG